MPSSRPPDATAPRYLQLIAVMLIALASALTITLAAPEAEDAAAWRGDAAVAAAEVVAEVAAEVTAAFTLAFADRADRTQCVAASDDGRAV